MPDVRIDEITDPEQFGRLGRRWDELLDASGQDDCFLTSGWIQTALEQHMSSVSELAIVTCTDETDGALIGAVPAYVTPPGGRSGTRRLRLLSSDTIAPHRSGAIVRTGHGGRAIGPLVDRILDWREDYDVIELTRLDAASPFLRELSGRADGCRQCLTTDESELGALALPGTWDEFMSSISKRLRQTIRHAWRRLEEESETRIETIEDPEDLPQAVADATSMFASRMSARYDREFVPSGRHEAFLQAICEQCLEAGALHFHFLCVDDQRVSFVIDLVHGQTVFAYKTGFHTEWAPYRVGMLIYSHGIRSAIDSGMSFYDFGPGRMEHKSRLGAAPVRTLSNLRLYAPSLAGRSAALEDRTKDLMRSTAKRILPDSVRARLSREREWRNLQAKWGR